MGPNQTAAKKYRGQIRGAIVKIKPSAINIREGREDDGLEKSSHSDAVDWEGVPKSSSTSSDVIKMPGSTVAKDKA